MKQALFALIFFCLPVAARGINVGSKAFTEGYVLGEYAAQILERDADETVVRRFGLGGTGILVQALRAGQIDVYPEYTGTILQTILNDTHPRTIDEINDRLAPMGLVISESLGFNDGYALAVTATFAQAHGLRTLSDLRKVAKQARAALSSEFVSRPDGYPGLQARYGLRFGENLNSLEHSLAYEAIAKGEADVTDVYTTDAKIEKLHLVVLEDDLHFFPLYQAVFLARREFVEQQPRAWAALRASEGRLDERDMRSLNGAVDIEKRPVFEVVNSFRGGPAAEVGTVSSLRARQIWRRTREHLVLVGLSLLFSVAVGIPLGIIAARRRRLGQVILLFSGTVQTIPSLALLCFLIPVFGIGLKPALAALCLYGLLPVVLNTFVGLDGIDPRLRDTSKALGLGFWNRLRLVELPLASPNILAGVKTSAIVGIGTATLAALIGAGGYGAPIVSGLAINDLNEILTGAVPAALMAIAAQLVFALLEWLLVPHGIKSSV